jgi:hypothetical protein
MIIKKFWCKNIGRNVLLVVEIVSSTKVEVTVFRKLDTGLNQRIGTHEIEVINDIETYIKNNGLNECEFGQEIEINN